MLVSEFGLVGQIYILGPSPIMGNIRDTLPTLFLYNVFI